MKFYQSFVDILNAKEATDVKDSIDGPTTKQLANGVFREMLLAEHGKTIEMIKAMAPSLAGAIRKPQRLLHDDEDYYVAIDSMTDTFYVCYRELLMIDIDFYKDMSTIELMVDHFKDYCAKHPGLKFKLYKSRNGIHGFLVSRRSKYTDEQTLALQLDLQSDFYYVVYSYLRGWSVRLNKKATDTKDELYEYLCDVGDGLADEHLLKLVNLHLELVIVFRHAPTNTMFGK